MDRVRDRDSRSMERRRGRVGMESKVGDSSGGDEVRFLFEVGGGGYLIWIGWGFMKISYGFCGYGYDMEVLSFRLDGMEWNGLNGYPRSIVVIISIMTFFILMNYAFPPYTLILSEY
jgi:hypothetical protein